MAIKVQLPIVFVSATRFATANPHDPHAALFWAAVRAGQRFDARLPLALLALCRRCQVELDGRQLLMLVLTGFAAAPHRRAWRLFAAARTVLAVLAQPGRGRIPIWSLGAGQPLDDPGDLVARPNLTRSGVLSQIFLMDERSPRGEIILFCQ